MKVKKEIWEEVCDFCGEAKTTTCDLCGKDLCPLHKLRLERRRVGHEVPSGLVFYSSGKSVVNTFCPDHLGLELMTHYKKSVRCLQGSAKNGN